MWRADSLEETLLLGKAEGRRRGWQRMRWLDDGITYTMDMSLNKLWEIVKDRGVWRVSVRGVARNWTRWTTTASVNDPIGFIPWFMCQAAFHQQTGVLGSWTEWRTLWAEGSRDQEVNLDRVGWLLRSLLRSLLSIKVIKVTGWFFPVWNGQQGSARQVTSPVLVTWSLMDWVQILFVGEWKLC